MFFEALIRHVALPLFAKSDGSDFKFDARRFGDDDLLQNVYWSTELGVGCRGAEIQKQMGWESKNQRFHPTRR